MSDPLEIDDMRHTPLHIRICGGMAKGAKPNGHNNRAPGKSNGPARIKSTLVYDCGKLVKTCSRKDAEAFTGVTAGRISSLITQGGTANKRWVFVDNGYVNKEKE
jgi:hypothetical protein